MRDWPAIMQGVLVGGPCLPLMAGDLRLEVVVVGLLGQLSGHLHPGGLGDEQPVGVIGPAGIEDLAALQQFWEPRPQRIEVTANSGADHDPAWIDRLTVLAAPLAGTDGTEETVLGEEPHA